MMNNDITINTLAELVLVSRERMLKGFEDLNQNIERINKTPPEQITLRDVDSISKIASEILEHISYQEYIIDNVPFRSDEINAYNNALKTVKMAFKDSLKNFPAIYYHE